MSQERKTELCFKRDFLILAFCLSLLTLNPVAQTAQATEYASNNALLRLEVALNETLQNVSTKIDASFLDKNALQHFYAERENKPFWIGNQGLSPLAKEMIIRLEESWSHGLNPAQYHLDEIKKLRYSKHLQTRTRLELLLSDAFVRYAHDLSTMRVEAETINLDSRYWRAPLLAQEALKQLPQSAENTSNALWKKIEPQSESYKRLRKELIRLHQEGAQYYKSDTTLSLNKAALKPMEHHKIVPMLKARLGVKTNAKEPTLYDDALLAAVIDFQRKHGLNDDGVIGPHTIQILNRTPKTRFFQIIANMERLRWLPTEKAERFIMVNIPKAHLWAIDKGQVEVEMPVIIGKPHRQTQPFITNIEGIRFNPDWTIPLTIKRYDILPRLRHNVAYLQDKGIELFKGYSKSAITLDPSVIDWKNMTNGRLRHLRMVQIPGDHNPLGRVRVMMPNKYNIFLHGTNHPELFSRPARTLSSGCIRLERPNDLAHFILGNEKEWREEQIIPILDSLKTQEKMVSKPLPVYVLYHTVWLDDEGKLVYGTDIYKRDTQLIAALENIGALPFTKAKKTRTKRTLSDVRYN